jgi:CheY-like chemotaxis protein
MEKLKDNPQTRHIPVHFISGTDQSRDAKQMGAIGHLLKPVSMAELSEAFKKIEKFIAKTLKNLLVMVNNPQHQQIIMGIVGGDNVSSTVTTTSTDAWRHLKSKEFDCIILDVEVEPGSGLKLLEQMYHEDSLSQIPVIIYAERELLPDEELILQRCADHLTVKAVRTPERLLDEVTLFLHQVEAKLPKEKQKILRMVHDKEAILAHKKVLIVDDDTRNIFALMSVLENKDMEVIAAQNGKEALEILNEQLDIAIVLMDIMMPEMDGYETMQRIRAQARFRKLPIIALTAKAMKSDKAKCIEAGANDYLAKPVDTDKLVSLMRVWLYR